MVEEFMKVNSRQNILQLVDTSQKKTLKIFEENIKEMLVQNDAKFHKIDADFKLLYNRQVDTIQMEKIIQQIIKENDLTKMGEILKSKAEKDET